jgi:hypothetical protein
LGCSYSSRDKYQSERERELHIKNFPLYPFPSDPFSFLLLFLLHIRFAISALFVQQLFLFENWGNGPSFMKLRLAVSRPLTHSNLIFESNALPIDWYEAVAAKPTNHPQIINIRDL